MNNKVEQFTLICGHLFYAKISLIPGAPIFCLKCNGSSYLPFPVMTDIDGNPIRQYYWRCRSRVKCYNRTHVAGNRHDVDSRAMNHARKYPTHEVIVIDWYGKIMYRLNQQESLDLELN